VALPPAPAPAEAAPEPAPPERTERTVERVGPRPEAQPEGAAAAFREASRLRREGKTALAMRRYRELLQRYPSSAEARASEIALGMLHLRGGSAGAGLRYFESYLGAAPGGQLAADALWGKTQALAAMGRNDEARRGLQLLIDRYPRSTYATAARAKLGISP
jgi:TolA-binding protein